MRIEVTFPDWITSGEVTLRLTYLNPVAIEALIETLRDALPKDDDRVRFVLDLWAPLTA